MSFIWTKLAQSLIKRVIALVISLAAGPKIAPILANLGVSIDPTQLSVGLYGLLEALRAWLTHQVWSSKLPKWLLAAL